MEQQDVKLLVKLLDTTSFRTLSCEAQFDQIKLALFGVGDDSPVTVVQLLIESGAINFARVSAIQPSELLRVVLISHIPAHSTRSGRPWN